MSSATRSTPPPARTREQLGAIARMPADGDDLDAGIVDGRSSRCSATIDPVNGGFGGAPKFPPASALDLLLARGAPRAGRADPRRDGRRRHPRSARRRLRPLLGRRRLARPPLREDALRQRPARPHLPARLSGARPPALSRRRRRDLRLGAARRCAAPRAASTPPSTPTPRASRGASTPGPRPRPRAALDGPGSTRRGRACSPTSASADAATSRAAASSTCPRGLGRIAAGGLRAAREALLAARAKRVRPGLDDKRLCAWNALMAGSLAEIGAALGEPRYLDAATRVRRLHPRPRCATPTAACCAPTTAGEARLNAYLEDHAYLLEALLDALRGDVRAALVRGRPARSPTR